MTPPDISFTLTASDKTTEAFNSVNKGLDGLQKNTDRFTQAGGVAGALGGNASNQLRNASYQITDFIVQVQGGQRVSLALSQQLPQLLAGFGAMGAALGLVAAVFPSIVAAFGSSVDEGKKLEESLGDINSAIGEVGKTARDFRMDDLYKEFNAANAVTREGIIEQVKFQQAMIETQRLLAEQSLSKSLQGIGDFGFLDKLKGAFADSGSEKLAKDLGVSTTLAEEMLPAIKAVRDHTDDAANFMQRFGLALAQSSVPGAQKLLKQMQDMAKAEQDAYAAQGKLSEAQQKMQKAGAAGQIAIAAKDKKAGAGKVEADPSAVAYGKAMEQLTKLSDDANASQLDLIKSQKVLYDLMVAPEWRDMPYTWKATAVAQFEEAYAAEQAADATKRLNDMLDKTESAGIEKARDDMLLLVKALEDGVIGEEKYLEAVKARLDLRAKASDAAAGEMDEFAKSAARNMQSMLADFLFDPFADGIDGMGKKFGQMLQRMAAEAAAAKIMNSLFGSMGQPAKNGAAGGEGDWGWIGKAAKWVGSFFADGGIMTSAGPLPLNKYANGGIATSPQLAMFGEGSTPEAYVPLPDGRAIPVKVSGQSGMTINQTIYAGQGTDSAQVRRSAAAGARAALGAMSGAQRYA